MRARASRPTLAACLSVEADVVRRHTPAWTRSGLWTADFPASSPEYPRYSRQGPTTEAKHRPPSKALLKNGNNRARVLWLDLQSDWIASWNSSYSALSLPSSLSLHLSLFCVRRLGGRFRLTRLSPSKRRRRLKRLSLNRKRSPRHHRLKRHLFRSQRLLRCLLPRLSRCRRRRLGGWCACGAGWPGHSPRWAAGC